MGTVDKALSLMRFFSPQLPELGLSELARKSGFDKATTLRCLNALERNGFVEQDLLSRKYRVGLSPFHLAQIREQSFPIESIIAEHLDALVARVGETAHGTLLRISAQAYNSLDEYQALAHTLIELRNTL